MKQADKLGRALRRDPRRRRDGPRGVDGARHGALGAGGRAGGRGSSTTSRRRRWLSRWATSRAPTTAASCARSHVGKTVTLMGWAATRRDLGGVIFIDLRDREGLCQVVARPEVSEAAHAAADRVRAEYVLAVVGEVRGPLRGDRQPQAADRHGRGPGPRDPRPVRGAGRRPSRSRTRSTPTRRCASSTATSTCAGRACSATSACGTR